MATKAQIRANRKNAQKSTGPKTTDGKATVAQNAVKHGLTAQKTLIPGENPADFELYRYEMLEELDPVGPTESMLADRIVSLSWRLRRTVRLQDETLHALCTPKPGFLFKRSRPEPDEASVLGRTIVRDFSDARVLDRLMMYERRIENSLYKTMHEFQKLTLIRKFDPPQAPQPKTSSQSLTTTQPTKNMQNKPNSQNAKMNLTFYKQKDYEHEPPLPAPPKQTQTNLIKPSFTPKTHPIEDTDPSPIRIEHRSLSEPVPARRGLVAGTPSIKAAHP